jgi:hypothetical protein
MKGMFVSFLEEIEELRVSELDDRGYSYENEFNVSEGFIIASSILQVFGNQ